MSDLSTRSLLLGLGAQVIWTVIGYVLVYVRLARGDQALLGGGAAG